MSAAAQVPLVPLSDGASVPALGLGTARTDDDTAQRTVASALATGYRLLDTAARYENEVGVGRGVAESGVPRAEVFVTTKLRGADHGRTQPREALQRSLERLGLDHVDLYLVHWPLPRVGKFVPTWEALVELREEGLTRSIGVSNFLPVHLDALRAAGLPEPVVNQVEFHPRAQRRELLAEHARRGIVTQAWAPLGGERTVLDDPVVLDLARRHGVSPARVVLRWDVQRGVVTIPKSADPGRMADNLDVFSFTLDDDEVAALDALDRGPEGPWLDPLTHEEF